MVNQQPDFQVQTVWQTNPMVPPTPVNQIMIQEGPGTMSGVRSGEFYLTLGHVAPPMLARQADGSVTGADGLVLPIATVGQFIISHERLREFRSVIDSFLDGIPETL
jgi:hypothetical protein